MSPERSSQLARWVCTAVEHGAFGLAADATYFTGGQTSIDDADKQGLQKNSRYGVTLSIPINSSWSAKLAWATALSTRIGGEFDVATLAFQYRWFDRPA